MNPANLYMYEKYTANASLAGAGSYHTTILLKSVLIWAHVHSLCGTTPCRRNQSAFIWQPASTIHPKPHSAVIHRTAVEAACGSCTPTRPPSLPDKQ